MIGATGKGTDRGWGVPSGRKLGIRSWLWLGVLLCGGLSWAAGAEADLVEKEPLETELPSLEGLVKIPTTRIPSRFEQKVTEAPAAVTIITSAEIKKYGYKTLSDVLRSVRSLYVTDNRTYQFLGVRGVNRGDYNSRMLVLVDGHRINDGLSDGALLGTAFPLDVDLIDRVEVIRGPSAVLYGNNAFFGVINVVTRKSREFAGLGAEGAVSVGSDEAYQRRVTLGHEFSSGLEMLFSATIYDSKGQEEIKQFDNTVNRYVVAEDMDEDHFHSFFARAGVPWLSFEGAYILRDKTVPTAPYGTAFNDPRAVNQDGRYYGGLKFTHQFAEEMNVIARIYYDHRDLTMVYPMQPASAVLQPLELFQEQQVGDWWGTEAQLEKRFLERHTLVIGGEYRVDFRQDRTVQDVATGADTINVHRDTDNFGIYAQGDIAILTNLHLNAGVRYDQYGDLEAAVNPRAALIYHPVASSTIKAIGGTAFRAPNFFELADPRYQEIDPETIRAYELIYEQDWGTHLRSTIGLFHNQIDDLIVFGDQGYYDNLTGAVAQGIEVGLQGQWRGGLQGRVSYSYQDTEDTETGERLTDAPLHLGNVNLTLPLIGEKLLAGVEFQYTSERSTTYQNPENQQTLRGPDVAGFGTVNLTLFSQNVIKGLEMSASIYNLLDTAYFDPSTPSHRQASIPQLGRTFRFKLTYRF